MLQESQKINSKAQESKKKGSYERINRVLHHQDLFFVPESIQIELISRYHDNSLAGHFEIEKTRKLLPRKYYWPSLCHDVETYVFVWLQKLSDISLTVTCSKC